MTDGNQSNRVAKVLSEKQSIAICLPTKATLDAVAAALALYFALAKEGKSVSVASPDEVDKSYGLVGQEKIQSTMASDGDVLVVSIPYEDGGVDNVNYNVDGDFLNIHITPEEGHERLDPKKVKFNYTGGKPDAIVTIYTPTLNSLGSIYENNKEQFEGVEIVNIDRHFTNASYGTLNFVDKKSPSMVEMINEVLKVMKTEIDKDIASNLYDGLVSATNNFTAHSVNAQTFRMAAFLLDHGAQKKPGIGGARSQVVTQGVSPQPAPIADKPVVEPIAPMPPPVARPVEQIGEDGDKEQVGTAEAKESKPKKAKLKPQIFQSGGLNKG